jgi:DNA polymerase-3 subunit gamma/tau
LVVSLSCGTKEDSSLIVKTRIEKIVMSQALYRKWRPHQWDEVIGQQHVVQTLKNAVKADRVAHAYLFAGPRGTGKTTTARLLAKAVNCLDEDLSRRPCNQCEHCQAVNAGRFLDLIEIDAASNTSVEDVRDLRDKINFSPNQGRYKVYIIDEVHMLSTAAFNALLKTLEEPPSHAIFILATTEVHKIPTTVLSRCQRHEFRRIPVVDIVKHLETLAEGEGLQVAKDALTLIARQSTGSMRDAISLLDQLASSGKKITLEMTQTVLGTAASQSVLDIVEALLNSDAAAGLDHIHAALDSGSDPRQFARQIVEYLRDLLLIRMGNASQIDAGAEIRAQMARHAQAFETQELLKVIRVFNHAGNEARSAWQPALPLEMAFVEALGSPGDDRSAAEENQAAAPARRPKRASSASKASSSASDAPPVQSASTEIGHAPQSEADIIFRQIEENWRKITKLVGEHSRQTQALLNSCRPFGVKDGVLFLGFNGEFAKSKMEKNDHIKTTCGVIAELMGKEVPLRCFVAAGGQRSLPPDVDSDGMVAAALRDLGGEIVDIQ